MNGSQHICFTDSAGKALFSIPDNGLLCLFYGNGDRHFAVCHRLDDTHAEIDGVNYSLPDFAKKDETQPDQLCPGIRLENK